MQTQSVAEELFALLGSGKQITPFSSRDSRFGVAEAYDAVAQLHAMRKARGEKPVGRKIGFTNRGIWPTYGITGPMWGYMYDTTVRDLAAADSFPVTGFPEALIEPEIALHLAATPRVGMDESELMDCVDWVAHGFEIVQSVYPGWQFSGADAIAAYGMHAGMVLGERHTVTTDRASWRDALPAFKVSLIGSDGARKDGGGSSALGNPLTALRFLIDELARFPQNEPLRAGEIITTGTLTAAMPVTAGQSWSTELHGIEIAGIRLGFTA